MKNRSVWGLAAALLLLTMGAMMLIPGCAVQPEPEPTIVTGWQTMEEVKYYYLEDGSLATGWQDMEDGRRYFAADGAMVTGWQEISGKRYWFDGNGVAAIGWQEVEGQKYYFCEDNALATGQVTIDGRLHNFADDGSLTTGFIQKEDGSYLYFNEGALVTGWIDHDEKRYYANEDGQLHTGWLELGEYRYYFHPDGIMATGANQIDGKQYYFTPKGIHIWLVNPWNKLHEDYNPDLVEISYYKVDRSCYNALVQMMEDCAEAGHEPMICSGYRTQADQSYLFGRKVDYFLEQGLDNFNAQVRAARIVAIPGTSEHQLGLAVDMVSTDYYVLDESQATTRTQQWLMEHCWEYGFILRYPLGTTEITGIIYEPWHYRYVGVEVALELRDLGITLEEYLGAVTSENSQ